MTPYQKCRERGTKMLLRWGYEMSAGEGQPNILAMVDHIHATDGSAMPGRIGAMFSPQAERADQMLRDFRLLDAEVTEYLIGYALGYSLSDLAREHGGSRSRAEKKLEGALSAWAMAVHFTS